MLSMPDSGRVFRSKPARAMSLRIGPVPLSHAIDGLEDGRCIEAVHARLMYETRLMPAGDDATAVVEDRVVEIEKKRSGKTHQS